MMSSNKPVVVKNSKNLNFRSTSDVDLGESLTDTQSDSSSISLQERHELTMVNAGRILIAFYTFSFLTILMAFLAALLVPRYQNLEWTFSQISSWSAITHELYFILCIICGIFKKKLSRRVFLHRDRFFTLCFPLSLYTMIFYVAFVVPFSIRFLDIRDDCIDPGECISVSGFVSVTMLNIFPFLLILIDTSLNSHRKSYRNPYLELIITMVYIIVYLLWSITLHTITDHWPTYVETQLARYPGISVVAHIGAVIVFISFHFVGRYIVLARRQKEAQKHFADSLLESIEDAWTAVPTVAQHEIHSFVE